MTQWRIDKKDSPENIKAAIAALPAPLKEQDVSGKAAAALERAKTFLTGEVDALADKFKQVHCLANGSTARGTLGGQWAVHGIEDVE